MHFLNKLDFVGYTERDGYEQFNCIKEILLDEVWDFNSQKITDMLCVVDDLHVLYLSQNFQAEEKLIGSLRIDIFLLFNEKMLSKTSNTNNA